MQPEIYIISQCSYKIAQGASKNLVLYTDGGNIHVSRNIEISIVNKKGTHSYPLRIMGWVPPSWKNYGIMMMF